MARMPSKESTRPLPQKPSPGKGPKVMMPEVKASSIAGRIIVSSSFPMSPLSPAWGLRPSTARRGFVMPKSRCRPASRRRSLRRISSLESREAIALTGMCVVAKATRQSPEAGTPRDSPGGRGARWAPLNPQLTNKGG